MRVCTHRRVPYVYGYDVGLCVCVCDFPHLSIYYPKRNIEPRM